MPQKVFERKTDLSAVNRSTRRQRKYLQNETQEQKEKRLLRQRMWKQWKLANETEEERQKRSEKLKQAYDRQRIIKRSRLTKLKYDFKKEYLRDPEGFKNGIQRSYRGISEKEQQAIKERFLRNPEKLLGRKPRESKTPKQLKKTNKKKSKRKNKKRVYAEVENQPEQAFDINLSEALVNYCASKYMNTLPAYQYPTIENISHCSNLLPQSSYQTICVDKNIPISQVFTEPKALDWNSYKNAIGIKIEPTENKLEPISEPKHEKSEVSIVKIKQEIQDVQESEQNAEFEDTIDIQEFPFSQIKTEY